VVSKNKTECVGADLIVEIPIQRFQGVGSSLDHINFKGLTQLAIMKLKISFQMEENIIKMSLAGLQVLFNSAVNRFNSLCRSIAEISDPTSPRLHNSGFVRQPLLIEIRRQYRVIFCPSDA
jgi:hypothetical protein